MPEIVKDCYDSWIRLNPNWEVIFLDSENKKNFLTKDTLLISEGINSMQAKSDFLRINLLREFGGVWVDATCFPVYPLDKWLPKFITSGFFAFQNPDKNFMISSWFLASVKGNQLTDLYCEKVNQFWKENPNLNAWNSKPLYRYFFKIFLLNKILDKNPRYWFSPIFIKYLKIHPYFWFHYSFEQLHSKFETVRKIWKNTPKISSDIPHKLQHIGLHSPLTDPVKKEILENDAPLYKLNWRAGINDEIICFLKTL